MSQRNNLFNTDVSEALLKSVLLPKLSNYYISLAQDWFIPYVVKYFSINGYSKFFQEFRLLVLLLKVWSIRNMDFNWK